MKRVTGIGGIFFKSRDPESLARWYEEHLGVEPKPDGYVTFDWREAEDPERRGYTVWTPFAKDTRYFEPSTADFMINYRVDDLQALLQILREEGVEVDDRVEEYEYGKFGWIMDPEGNRIELWEPTKNSPGNGKAPE